MAHETTYTAHWYVGDYMSGWMTNDLSLIDQGIAGYVSGWGTQISNSVAQALTQNQAPTAPRDGDSITFTAEDVTRVLDLIRQARERRDAQRATVEMVRCDCGHTVARDLVMVASRGTSCPDCYDRMSD